VPGQDNQPGAFALTIVPPARTAGTRPAPRDVVFLLDRSRSMEGWKMVAARRAVGRMIDTLLDHDRLTVLAFDNDAPRDARFTSLVDALRAALPGSPGEGQRRSEFWK
jgi:Ca-activated chloride channel family protein